jgi:hypothetical protein
MGAGKTGAALEFIALKLLYQLIPKYGNSLIIIDIYLIKISL